MKTSKKIHTEVPTRFIVKHRFESMEDMFEIGETYYLSGEPSEYEHKEDEIVSYRSDDHDDAVREIEYTYLMRLLNDKNIKTEGYLFGDMYTYLPEEEEE